MTTVAVQEAHQTAICICKAPGKVMRIIQRSYLYQLPMTLFSLIHYLTLINISAGCARCRSLTFLFSNTQEKYIEVKVYKFINVLSPHYILGHANYLQVDSCPHHQVAVSVSSDV